MNSINKMQKIFAMVAVGSIILWLITVFGLGFDGDIRGYEGEIYSGFQYYFKQGSRTNWLGIIAIFNIAVSILGFFLFKDKK